MTARSLLNEPELLDRDEQFSQFRTRLRQILRQPRGSRSGAARDIEVVERDGRGWIEYNGVPVYRASILAAPGARDAHPDAAEANRLTATLSSVYEGAFTSWLTASLRAARDPYESDPAARGLLGLSVFERAALAEGAGDAGGFAAPVSFLAEIIASRAARSVIRPLVRAFPVAGTGLNVALAQDHATSPGLYSGGWVGGWYGESGGVNLTDAAFGLGTTPLRKARVATRVSGDLVDDAPALIAWLALTGGENLAALEDGGFINGTGADNEPLGLLRQFTGSTTDVSGTTADQISNTTGDMGSAAKISDLLHSLPSQYLGNARWIMRSASEGKIRKLVNASGDYLWPRLSRELLAQPIDHSDFVPADGTDGNRVLMFGDLGAAAVIAEKSGIVVEILRERYAEDGSIGIFLKSRSNILLTTPNALKIGSV